MILVIGATYTNKMNSISATKMYYLSEAASMVEQVINYHTDTLAHCQCFFHGFGSYPPQMVGLERVPLDSNSIDTLDSIPIT